MNLCRRGWFFRLVLLTGVAAACREEPRPETASAAILAGVPVMPQSSPRETAAGSDAVEAAYSVIAPVDSVAAWYRRTLTASGWQMTGDVRSPTGGVTLHAHKDARPVWVIIEPVSRGIGSIYSIIGAEPGPAAERGPRD